MKTKLIILSMILMVMVVGCGVQEEIQIEEVVFFEGFVPFVDNGEGGIMPDNKIEGIWYFETLNDFLRFNEEFKQKYRVDLYKATNAFSNVCISDFDFSENVIKVSMGVATTGSSARHFTELSGNSVKLVNRNHVYNFVVDITSIKEQDIEIDERSSIYIPDNEIKLEYIEYKGYYQGFVEVNNSDNKFMKNKTVLITSWEEWEEFFNGDLYLAVHMGGYGGDLYIQEESFEDYDVIIDVHTVRGENYSLAYPLRKLIKMNESFICEYDYSKPFYAYDLSDINTKYIYLTVGLVTK